MSSGQVDHLTVFLEEVKLSFPVVTHDEGIDTQIFDIVNLLFPIAFRDNEIDISYCFNYCLSFLKGGVALLAFELVELIG